MGNDALLVLDKVCKSFGPEQVIDEVTVEVHAGKVSVLLGENGAGKSTLIKMIAGVHEPDAGRILMDGKGKIIVLEGVPGASATNERGEGFDKGLAEYKDIEVVSSQTANFDRAEALDVVTNLMQANPDATGILAMNDEMALGAIQALGDKAGKDVKVVGFDGTEDGFKAVEDGTLVATIAQNPAELGKQSVQILAKAIKGEEVEANVQVAVDTVDEKNIAEYAGE